MKKLRSKITQLESVRLDLGFDLKQADSKPMLLGPTLSYFSDKRGREDKSEKYQHLEEKSGRS